MARGWRIPSPVSDEVRSGRPVSAVRGSGDRRVSRTRRVLTGSASSAGSPPGSPPCPATSNAAQRGPGLRPGSVSSPVRSHHRPDQAHPPRRPPCLLNRHPPPGNAWNALAGLRGTLPCPGLLLTNMITYTAPSHTIAAKGRSS